MCPPVLSIVAPIELQAEPGTAEASRKLILLLCRRREQNLPKDTAAPRWLRQRGRDECTLSCRTEPSRTRRACTRRAAEIGDKTKVDGIGADYEYDRNGYGRCVSGKRRPLIVGIVNKGEMAMASMDLRISRISSGDAGTILSYPRPAILITLMAATGSILSIIQMMPTRWGGLYRAAFRFVRGAMALSKKS